MAETHFKVAHFGSVLGCFDDVSVWRGKNEFQPSHVLILFQTVELGLHWSTLSSTYIHVSRVLIIEIWS
eukprot:m.1645934 g.1645934  ORF g.1645934 m.1645934 type:complete len:69 (+) comp69137_c0_seq1:1-207(+)